MKEPANYRKFNGLVTYREARAHLDQVFDLTRKKVWADVREQFKRWYYEAAGNREIQGALTGEGSKKDWSEYASLEDLYLRRAMEGINEQWREAIKALRDAVLRQGRKSRSRKTVRTVNFRGLRNRKAVPSLSQSARRLRGEKKRSTERSHVKGNYVPRLAPGKRGRPSIPREIRLARKAAAARRKREAQRRATAERRAKKGWKPYRRNTKKEIDRPARWQSERTRARLRASVVAEVRAEGRGKEEAKDTRGNHRPEYGYRRPRKRLRRTAAQVARWGYKKRTGKPREPFVAPLSGAQVVAQSAMLSVRASESRAEKMRSYWEWLKKEMRKRLSPGAMPNGRPLGSGDKKSRKKRKGGNAGSFGARVNERSRKWTEWREARKPIAGRFRRALGLVVWERRRLGAYRNDPQAYAGTKWVLERKLRVLEAVRAELARHDAARPV